MEDRLIEFQKMAGVSTSLIQPAQDGSDGFLPQFSAKTRLLQQAINQVRYNNQEITRLKDKHKEATLNDVEKKISNEIRTFIDQNNVLSQTIQGQLNLLKEEVESSKESDPDEPETRMKVISHQSLSAKFSDVIKESQSVQLEYKAAVKDKLARQAKIYNNSLTPDQVEQIINDPEGMANLVQSIMVGGGAHTKLQNAVSDIQDKYKDILKLERSVEIMHQMFVDMSMLVQASGVMVDSIETNVTDARDYVAKAVVKLEQGQQSHQTAKKWQCMITICLLIFVGVIFFLFFR